jgi:chitinase
MAFLSVGYYPDWTKIAIGQLPSAGFTHLCHAFALAKATTGISAPKDAKLFCTTCKKQKIVPILSLGGAESGPALALLTADAPKRTQTIAQIVQIIKSNGYSGLDIDWEAPANAAESKLLSAFVSEIRTALGPKFLLTMAVPASNWSGQWFDAITLLPHINYLNIMSYDNAGEWSDRADHNAPFAFYQASLEYWLTTKHWPKEKLLLGLPCYGRGFAVKTWGAKVAKKAKHPYISYNDLLKLEAKEGWTRDFDTEAQNPFLRSPNGTESVESTEIISFDDPMLIQKKIAYAKSQKIAGVFYWEVTQDVKNGHHGLVG